MLTKNHICEGLSRAYIQAVAHRAGFNLSVREFDYGLDGTFHEVSQVVEPGGKPRYRESGFKIDFQAKASSSPNLIQLQEETLRYTLEAKSQRDLVQNGGTPRILVVLLLPSDETQWLTCTEDALTLRRCAWWMSLRGQAPTTNDETVRIEIPRAQRFDVEALTAMMNRVRSGDSP